MHDWQYVRCVVLCDCKVSSYSYTQVMSVVCMTGSMYVVWCSVIVRYLTVTHRLLCLLCAGLAVCMLCDAV